MPSSAGTAFAVVADMGTAPVVVYSERPEAWLATHEAATLGHVGRAVARVTGREWGGYCLSGKVDRLPVFMVPDDTLLTARARELRLEHALDLLGGMVPAAISRTKAIGHALVTPSAARPDGWPGGFPAAVEGIVLPGLTAFTPDDAASAARRLLRLGPVRAKRTLGTGGRDQRVLAEVGELTAVLDAIDLGELAQFGIVLEVNLADVTTLSVGQTVIDDITLTYHGVQRETVDNHGRTVYGGSDLVCVRGGWDALAATIRAPLVRTAVDLARAYDRAADAHTGVVASRRNYDVGHGRDAGGRTYTGVFEHSWRVGGATAAEVAAFEAFRRDPGLRVVHASTIERFGRDLRAPQGAAVVYEGVDPDVGPIGCYAVVTHQAREAA